MSEQKTFKLSLSRAHNVAEGLKREINRLANEIVESAKPIKVFAEVELVQVDKRLEKVKVTQAKLAELHAVRSVVRQAIARRNSEISLHDALTQKRDIDEELSQLNYLRTSVRDGGREESHDKENVEALLIRQLSNGSLVGAKTRILDDSFFESLEARIRELQTLSSSIAYAIADLNASNHISVEIPAEVASLIGIA